MSRYAVVLDLPDLRGALCAGLWPYWDAHVPGETDLEAERRRNASATTCLRCPALQGCRQARDGRSGVWAGEIYLADTSTAQLIPDQRCTVCGSLMVSPRRVRRDPSLRQRFAVVHGNGRCTRCRRKVPA